MVAAEDISWPKWTNELMYELLRRMDQRREKVGNGIGDIRSELISVRGHMVSTEQDIHNIYSVITRNNERLDRIEHRLAWRELADPQRPL